MEANVNYHEIIRLISGLPIEQINKIKDAISKLDPKVKGSKDLKTHLKNGPIMNDEQFEHYKEQREFFNEWRIK